MQSDRELTAQGRHLVLWDIDGTVVSQSLERHFLKYLHRHGHVRPIQLLARSAAQLLRPAPPRWHRLKLAYLRGNSVSDVDSWIVSCWESTIRPSLFEGSVEAIRRLHSRGVRQILLTGTPRPLAEPLADYLEIADVIAAEPEIKGGLYSGRLKAPHPKGRRKLRLAQAWLAKHEYDWKHTVVVGDHWADRFLLAQGDVAVVVRPDRKLRKYAQRQGWHIVDDVTNPNALVAVFEHIGEQV